MKDIFDALEKGHNEFLHSLEDATAWSPSQRFTAWQAQASEISNMAELMGRGLTKHLTNITDVHKKRWQDSLSAYGKAVEDLTQAQAQGVLYNAFESYWKDAAQRVVLTMDTLRQRGDNFIEHEEAGCPPVLIYDYDLVLDGADLPHPCCYMLLKIRPPENAPVPRTQAVEASLYHH